MIKINIVLCLQPYINFNRNIKNTMDIDENDMLMTNTFVPTPQLNDETPAESSEEFRKYYSTEMNQREEALVRQSLDRMSIRSVHLDENTDANSLMNTNRFQPEGESEKGKKLERGKMEIKTYVSIDSRDRIANCIRNQTFSRFSWEKLFTT